MADSRRMGTGGRTGTDRLRTIWTTEMDRYFIDLMLEQVRKGNRINDRLFSKRAWKHMATLFNAKFRFQYEKDVLKNRHKTLRNLYRAIKNLLEQKGFSWDETRQMVTADNKVWDDYIKEHPDARSYRIKNIPYYGDLYEIYNVANTEGKGDISSQIAKVNTVVSKSETGTLHDGLGYPTSQIDGESGDNLIESSSHSGSTTMPVTQLINFDNANVEALHDITIDDNHPVSSVKVTVDGPLQPITDMGSRSGTRSRTYWQPPMDRYFIDLMLDHVQKGNQIDGLFPKQVWMEMLASFNAKFGFHYDIDILKNRYKTMRRQYNVIKKLLKLDGFVWDDTREMVTADDCIWQDYIKEHTDARQYMTRPVPYFKDLCLICRDINVDRTDSISAHRIACQSLHSPAASVSTEDLVGEKQESSHIADLTNKRQLESPSSSSHSKRARRKEENMTNAIRDMATAVSSLADKRRDEEDSNSVPIENVIEAIQALPDMDEDLVLDACDFLEDEKKAKTFLALDTKLRKKWLIRKLRPQQ